MDVPHLEPGEQIHHYVVEARVGGGGTATVYRVRHAILQHTLALKVLNPEHVGRADLRHLFLAEGRIQAAVRHPSIVMVTDAVVDAPRRLAGLVMEYIEGPDLSELIARFQGPPSTALVRSLAIPILEALHHAHGEGIVHRDVKPSNVLLTRDAAGIWRPRVADFGIAYLLDGEGGRKQPGLGTTAFMCPEQQEGGEPSPQWDVFAFGCLLHELATGVHPFEGADDESTRAAIRHGPAPLPKLSHPGIDPILERTILAALAKDPMERAPDCRALLDLLMETRPSPVPSVLPTPSVASNPVPPTFLETSGPEHQRRAWKVSTSHVRVGTEDVEVPLGASADLAPVHCVLNWNGEQWVLTNKGASGTRVNGARVTSIPLEDGDLLRVGHEVLKFHTTMTIAPRTRSVVGPHLVVPGRLIGEPDDRLVPILPTPLVIGKGTEADIQIAEPTAARKHCRVKLQGMDVIIEDLGSTIGTRVDDTPIRFRRLDDGAVIGIGPARLRFKKS